MKGSVAGYFETLVSEVGSAWNRFWFTPADPTAVSVLRLLTGSMACWYLISFANDLPVWFGAGGLLPIDTVRQLTESEPGRWNGRASILSISDDAGFIFAVQLGGLAIAAAFTAGFATRITSVLTLLILLSFIHRGPMIAGQFEPVLTMMLFYLCLAPCQRRYSLDQWLRRRRGAETGSQPVAEPRSVAANVCQRLMQVHVSAMYLMMGLTKLGGSDVWWDGLAMWWLIAHTESRLIDLTFLHRHMYLVNFWTHAAVWFELLFGVLVWNRLARPLLLCLAIAHWLLLGLITGLLSFAVMMLVASMSFIEPEGFRGILSPDAGPGLPPGKK
jgi:hypothetical protein